MVGSKASRRRTVNSPTRAQVKKIVVRHAKNSSVEGVVEAELFFDGGD
jgi:hypothetical protein